MKTNNETELVRAAATIAAKGASEYLRKHNLKADPDALASCLKAMVKFYLPNALRDAREAFECNMIQIGVATFSATMIQAGIDAAKEAGQAEDPRPLALQVL